jgi:ribonucleoside-diphosphate reductase alpha chain
MIEDDNVFVKFEDVKDLSTEDYFNNNQFSIDAFNKKYAQYKNETYVLAVKRVCDYIASAEENEELRKYWSERWFDEIYNDWWHPAGSIMQGAASDRSISMANCTTISLGMQEDTNWDNLESIIKNTAYTVAKTAAFRQGLGVDFSKLRPRGLEVKNSSNESQGVVHWMKFIDSIGNYIGQKGRIPAMLFSLSVDHPDVEEFIKVKSDYTIIQNANISVQTNDAFYAAVEADVDWEMSFNIPAVKAGDKIYVDVHSADKDCLKDDKGYYRIARKDRAAESVVKKIRARELLELIAKNMTANAEPGIQQIDMARRWSNSDYVYDPNSGYNSKIISTNACSEQYLSRESLCVLASINVARFSTDKVQYKEELRKIAYSVNRFLDNVNTMEVRGNTYATPHQKLAIEMLRRTGAGVTNVAGWLFRQNMEYGSVAGNNAMHEFNRTYNYFLYESSINLGKEKGSFGLFVREKYEQSPFIKLMMEQGLVFEAMRNVTCSSIAPTGTLSLMFRDFVMSYGVEPGFGMYFWKRTRMSGKYEYYFCVPSVVREYFKNAGCEINMASDCIKDTWDGSIGLPIAKFIDDNAKRIGINFKRATEIKALDKLDLMSKLMKDVDSSISVTYTLPEGASWKDTYDLIVEANRKGVKSIAAFPDKKMYGIVSYIPFKELAFNLKNECVEIYKSNFTEEEYAELNIVVENKNTTNDAPKRKKSLVSDLYQISVRGHKYLVVVGIQDGSPYEIFGGQITEPFSFKMPKKGMMVKVKSGYYKLTDMDGNILIDDFGCMFTGSEQILFRMVSTSLRHGIPIKFLQDQLSKAAEDVSDLASATSRVLKKYISDGEKAGGKCPNCGKNQLIYIDGCVSCGCGWSKGCG